MLDRLLMPLLVALMLRVAVGQYQLICPTPPIKAAAGDRADIECHVEPPVDLKTKTVEFSNTSNVLLIHRSREVDQSSSRISLSDEDLTRGIVKLQIFSVQLSDSGLYEIHIPQLRAGCTLNLSVVKPEAPDDIEGDNNSTTPGRGRYGLTGVGAVIIIIIIIIIIILKRKRIQHLWKQLRGRKDQRAEPEDDGHEMKRLNREGPELV